MLERIRRLLKHRWHDEANTRRLIPATMRERLLLRIQASEQRHRGEIRICIEGGLPSSYLWRRASLRELTRQRALMLFGKLRVWDTEHNNGVLIYLLLAEHTIELVADRGLNQHVSAADWQAMVERMRAHFQQGRFEEGLTQALEEVSTVLVRHFPLAPGQPRRNELPDAPLLHA